MAMKNITQNLLKRLEEGTAEIYSRYRSRLKETQKKYDVALEELEDDHRRAMNAASAQGKIERKNTLEKMADAGYVGGGETVQVSLAAGAARAADLRALSGQQAKNAAQLQVEKIREEQDLLETADREAAELKGDTLSAIREQENLDREFEAEENQRKFENDLALKEWEWKKSEAASAEKEKNPTKQEEGLVPKIEPYAYLEAIVEKNTVYYPQKGYKTLDRRGILQAINDIVRDTNVSRSYRYELYLYAKSMGYLNIE